VDTGAENHPHGTGIWSFELRYYDPAAIVDAASELEELGYTAVWLPDVGGDVFDALDRVLGATTTIVVASGIVNIWAHDAAEVVQWWHGLAPADRARTLLGLGVSHGPLIGDAWRQPVARMSEYLDACDAGALPTGARCLAALGPRMLALARDRSAGAHPYLVPPEHTAGARAILGDAYLAVEQGVVLETDKERARDIARHALEIYCGLPNYVGNWKRLGLTDDDVEARSDRLVDTIIAWGDVDAIAARVAEHRAAGADHVCIQVLNPPGAPMNLDAWRELAPALCGNG
jgi:probable F420-dependent oxidoreductase